MKYLEDRIITNFDYVLKKSNLTILQRLPENNHLTNNLIIKQPNLMTKNNSNE